jgi:chemotaxis protein MotA
MASESESDTGFDTGTIIGVVAGVGLITLAVILGGDGAVFVNLNALLIVLGGMTSTCFIAFQSSKILEMVPVIINAFRPEVMKPVDYIDEIMALASKYRSGGMKVLENAEAKVENRFLKNGIAMIVDGYNGREIYAILDHEINSLNERHNAGQKILRFAGVQAPVFGMAGTLIGLIQMLMHIDNPSTIGPALATALITTFYGLILANLIVTPITAKLAMRTESESNLIKTIRLGVIGIFEKSNPAKIQKNMNSLLAPDERKE